MYILIRIFVYSFLASISFLVLLGEFTLSKEFMAMSIIWLSTKLVLGLMGQVREISYKEE